MSKLLEDSEALVPLWDGIGEEVEDFKATEYRLLSEGEKDFFDLLTRYVRALRKTVSALVNRQILMNEGAKGSRGNPMTWAAYQEKETQYQQAVNEYMAIGEELNEARYVVFDEDTETNVSLIIRVCDRQPEQIDRNVYVSLLLLNGSEMPST